MVCATSMGNVFEVCINLESKVNAEETESGEQMFGALLNGDGTISGPTKGEVWGLDVNKTSPEFAVVGEDSFLRIWSIEARRTLVEVMGEMCLLL